VAHHKNSEQSKIGIVDIVIGLVVFVLLWAVVARIAGPEGFGFLKGRLTPEYATEMLISGVLILGLWAIMGPLVMEPYLNAFYERESRTSGLAAENVVLKSEVEKLKADLAAEIKTARLEGVRRRDEKVAAAKKQALEIVDSGKKVAEDEWKVFDKEIISLKKGLMGSIDNEVSSLSSEILKKVLPSEISSKYLH